MKGVLLFVLSVALAGSTRAAVFTNAVSVDAFVRAAAPALNYGAAGALSVSGANAVNGSGISNGVFDAFIRFNTSDLLTNFNSLFGSNNWVINDARLRVTETGAPNNSLFNRGTGAFEIRWIANDTWIEGTGTPNSPSATGINYNDELTLFNSTSDISLGTFTNTGLDGTLTFPLALPNAFLDDIRAGGEVGLCVTAVDPDIGFTFDSRSFGIVSARPFLEVSAVPGPALDGISLSGTDIVLSGTNGAANGTYYVLASTNPALPLSEWSQVATNVLLTNGGFFITLSNAVNGVSSPAQFFILRTQ
jgi:hypothetical protein